VLARGESERATCLGTGIGLTAWNGAQRVNAHLRARLVSAGDYWARLRHKQHAAASRKDTTDVEHYVVATPSTHRVSDRLRRSLAARGEPVSNSKMDPPRCAGIG